MNRAHSSGKPVGGLRPEVLYGSHRRLTVDRAQHRRTAPALEESNRVQQRPAQPVDRDRPPVAATAPEGRAEFRLAAQVLGIVAVLALSFLLELTVLGNLRSDRDQARLAALFRAELAQPGFGVPLAPVGPFDEAGKLLAPGAPVALLEIPRLALREVVGEGTSSGTLMSGPGHRRDTPLPGQSGTSVIAGRRATYGEPFGSIDQLHPGDAIMVTTGQGKQAFTVLEVRHAGDQLPPPLTSGQGRLTLVTTQVPATGLPLLPLALQPTGVLFVDAALTSATQPRPPQLSSQVLLPAEALMAGDSSALLDVVGWAVLLVAAGVATVWVRFRTGWWQAWVISLPVLITLGLTAADEIAALLPNLL
ncbi:MAG: class E sortase [Pseudonocardiaceae bacterium]